MNKKALATLVAVSTFGLPAIAAASPNIAGGVWYNWAHNMTDNSAAAERSSERMGTFGSEALIIYADHAQEDGPWSFSSETRFGPGSFTNPALNSTGNQFGIHKAWVGYDIASDWDLKVGKTAVPFGWKTVNFWPGDMLLGGYADQMDVGAKVSGGFGDFGLSAAYFHQDDWGTSTDTMDDNGHWGTPATYRKIQTVVGDFNYTLSTGSMSHKFGASLQNGKLEDVASSCGTSNCSALDNGSHSAGVLYYQGDIGPAMVKAQYMMVNRDIPNMANDVENQRWGLTGGYSFGDWFAYMDVNGASTDTDGNNADSITAFAPGVRYSYGPGWIYAEYLSQDGFIDGNGDVTEAANDFKSLYLTVDYYF